MAEQTQRKRELTSELGRARARFSQNFAGFREDIDVSAHMKSAFRRHKTAWLSGGAILGLVLAKLPARKKKVKVYVNKKDNSTVEEGKKAGLLLLLLNFGLSMLKPTLVGLISQKITGRRGGAKDTPFTRS